MKLRMKLAAAAVGVGLAVAAAVWWSTQPSPAPTRADSRVSANAPAAAPNASSTSVSSAKTVRALQGMLLEAPRGQVSAQANLSYRFSEAVVPKAMIGKLDDEVVSLTPVGSGHALWQDERTLVLSPVSQWPAGETVRIQLHGNVLTGYGLTGAVDDVVGSVEVLSKRLSIKELGFTLQEDVVSYAMEVTADDDLTEKELTEQLQLDQSSVPEASLYLSALTPRRWQVTVVGLTKGPGSFRLSWKHAADAKEFAAERVVQLPAPDSMAVLSTRFSDQDGQRFEVRFTKPLANQELTGLVQLNGQTASARINGNALEIFPSQKLSGNVQLTLASSLKAASGETLGTAYQHQLQVSSLLPAVRFVGQGQILPNAERLLVPVEATNVSALQVRVFQVFPDNISQYLQSADGNLRTWESQQTGRYIAERTLPLTGALRDQTQLFQLDVTELVGKYRGSIFRLETRILPQHSLYPCDSKLKDEPLQPLNRLNYEGYYQEQQIPERLWRFYQSQGEFDWSQRQNPCHPYFYSRSEQSSEKIFFASNIGLIAKKGQDQQLHITTTALDSGMPLPNTQVALFNYQHQPIGQGVTDSHGFLTLKPEGEAFLVQASREGDTGYLRVPGNDALPTNQFDTGGVTNPGGLKAFFYAERNVWRPGDAIYLNLILQDKAKLLPDNFPVSLDFFNPQGQKVRSLTAKPTGRGFYRFDLATAAEAPTGNYTAVARVADQYFDISLKVENILPNRLKLQLDVPTPFGLDSTLLTLTSQWLSGASAAGLKADVELKLQAMTTRFDGFQGYQFDDEWRVFSPQKTQIWQGQLGPTGEAPISYKPELGSQAPGMLKALFLLRVFEPSGQFSTQYKEATLSPFARYVGFNLPEPYRSGEPLGENTVPVTAVMVDAAGKVQTGHSVRLELAKLRWRWWWDRHDQQYDYASDSSAETVVNLDATTDGQGLASFNLDPSGLEHGRYRVRVCDASNDDGHCASGELYVGWGWDNGQSRDSSTRLGITADQERYQVGQVAKINVPAGPARQVLVSLENASQVLEQRWVSLSAEQQTIEVPLDARMVPNVYAHVSQILPHQQRANDLPLRSYGIVNLLVDDPNSKLQPVLTAPVEVTPQSTVEVKVHEQQGRPMTYTLALVDEGLLGITDFKTPNPHAALYRREALGVQTWDLFDSVVGAYATDLSRLLALGGSELIAKRDNKRLQRFKPLVQSLGPFELKAGETASHTLTLPAYSGAVRWMLVAGDGYAFGHTEKEMKVRQDLDIYSTVPRVVGPGDQFAIPVTVFWQGQAPTTVKLRATSSDAVLLEVAEQTVSFQGPGEQTVYLQAKARELSGTAQLQIQAEGAGLVSREQIDLPVRPANTPEQRRLSKLLAPGEQWQPKAELFGLPGSHRQWFSVEALQNFDLTGYLRQLSDYPHGCVEQTTSRVLPLLFAAGYQSFTGAQQQKMTRAIMQQLEYLPGYQLSDGRYGYWRDGGYYVEWADLYAGYFLVTAKARGFALPKTSVDAWLAYHKTAANQFGGRDDEAVTLQSFRLYVLAKAQAADLGAMNRLRDYLLKQSHLPMARQLLALAYLSHGHQAAGRELADPPSLAAEQKTQGVLTSVALQRIVRLQALRALGQEQQALQLAQAIAMDEHNWYGTIEQAWGSQVLTEMLSQPQGQGPQGQSQAERRFTLQASSQALDIGLSQPGYSLELPEYQAETFSVTNTGTVPLAVSLLRQGVPATGTEQQQSAGIELTRQFTDLAGQPIAIEQLKQGQDVLVWLTVRNSSNIPLQELALSQVFAAGFELRSSLLSQDELQQQVQYQRTGDDRIDSYFSLTAQGKGQQLVFKTTVNAAYAGRFYLPGWQVQAMYNPAIKASLAGMWLEIRP